jgi:hypothetical protein
MIKMDNSSKMEQLAQRSQDGNELNMFKRKYNVAKRQEVEDNIKGLDRHAILPGLAGDSKESNFIIRSMEMHRSVFMQKNDII